MGKSRPEGAAKSVVEGIKGKVAAQAADARPACEPVGPVVDATPES